MIKKKLFFLFFFLQFYQTSLATDYYINGSTGNDTNLGTSTSLAWKTFKNVSANFIAGNTFFVSPGNYLSRVQISKSGAQSSPIRMIAIGSGVIVQGFSLNGSKYITIEGFEISLPRQASLDDEDIGNGIFMRNTQYCEIKNNYIHHTLREGIYVAGSTSLSNRVYGNRIEYAGGYAGITVEGDSNVIEGNDISHTIQHPLYPTLSTAGGSDADGIKFSGNNIIMRKNYIHHIEPKVTGNIDPHIDAFQTFGPATNITIEGNHINFTFPDSMMIDTEPQVAMVENSVKPVQNFIIRNNVSTAFRGFNIWGTKTYPITNVSLYNNTFYAVKDYDIECHFCSNSAIKNNMFSVGGKGVSVDSGVTFSNNGVPGSLTLRTGDIRVLDPKFVNPSMRDFHLQSNSPLINTGINIGLSFDFDNTPIPQGNLPDIGAFEFKSGSSPGDTTAPVITLNGSTIMTLIKGGAFVDPGATASDNVDGNISSLITKTGIVDTSKSGTYIIKYNVKDSTGNVAVTKERTVNVSDSPSVPMPLPTILTVSFSSTVSSYSNLSSIIVNMQTSGVIALSDIKLIGSGTFSNFQNLGSGKYSVNINYVKDGSVSVTGNTTVVNGTPDSVSWIFDKTKPNVIVEWE